MAWFNFGKQEDSSAKTLADAPVESVESLRARAKRRLIGSLVLVLSAVIGFPLLFDTQPRPVLVDVPIEIPDKNKVAPLKPPAATAPTTPAPAARVDEKSSLQAKEEIVQPGPVSAPLVKQNQPSAGTESAQSATKTVAPTLPSADRNAQDASAKDKAAKEKAAADKLAADKVAAEKAAAEKASKDKAAEAARAQALLEGKAPTAAASAAAANSATGERFIVQFGSFAEESKAREVRQKVERTGLKTYAQVADTKEGKRHRVRVGPFSSRADAEKAANKIKSLDLPAAILTL
ncbi:MAG: SPOR domain-containing protein [Brachymonas sp.]